MEWADEGILLGLRPHGEQGAVLAFLTAEHGRHLGLAHGARGRSGGRYQPGNRMSLRWRARIEDQLGTFTCEPMENLAARLLSDASRLAGLASLCALVDQMVPEREPQPGVYRRLGAALDAMTGEGWAAEIARFELALLAELGFGLDLSSCAATGATTDLVYVSPKSARAVSRAAGAPYHDRLLPLPPFLRDPSASVAAGDITAAFALTGWFLQRHATAPGRELPPARGRLLERLVLAATVSSGKDET